MKFTNMATSQNKLLSQGVNSGWKPFAPLIDEFCYVYLLLCILLCMCVLSRHFVGWFVVLAHVWRLTCGPKRPGSVLMVMYLYPQLHSKRKLGESVCIICIITECNRIFIDSITPSDICVLNIYLGFLRSWVSTIVWLLLLVNMKIYYGVMPAYVYGLYFCYVFVC